MPFYIINKKTIALMPYQPKKTKVIEENGSFIIKESLAKIINFNCYLNGSSLSGRIAASSYIIGSTYKAPIIISEQQKLILLPTHSQRHKDCSWFVLNKIINYHATLNGTIIEFKNHQKITLNITYNKIDKQILRATRLESTLNGRRSQNFSK